MSQSLRTLRSAPRPTANRPLFPPQHQEQLVSSSYQSEGRRSTYRRCATACDRARECAGRYRGSSSGTRRTSSQGRQPVDRASRCTSHTSAEAPVEDECTVSSAVDQRCDVASGKTDVSPLLALARRQSLPHAPFDDLTVALEHPVAGRRRKQAGEVLALDRRLLGLCPSGSWLGSR